jgi:hypothetical protein
MVNPNETPRRDRLGHLLEAHSPNPNAAPRGATLDQPAAVTEAGDRSGIRVEDVIKNAIGSFVADKHDPAEAAREAIAALEAQGYVVVPVEPTVEMCVAALASDCEVNRLWSAMLNARPASPSPQAQAG